MNLLDGSMALDGISFGHGHKKMGEKKRISIGIGGSLSCTHIEMYWKLFIKGLTYFKYVQCMGDVEQC